METGVQEAKLLDDSIPDNSQAVEIVPDDDHEELIILEDEESHDDPEDAIIQETLRTAAPLSDHSELSTSLAVLQSYKTVDGSKLTAALEALADLGHEIDFGVKITKPESLAPLLHIVKEPSFSSSDKEIAVRVIGASLRNNPAAIKNTFGLKVTDTLIETIHELGTDDLQYDTAGNKLAGRVVYALGSLVSNGEGDPAIYSEADREYTESNGGLILRRLFWAGDSDVKRKIAVFASDRVLLWPVADLREWSKELQTALAHDKLATATKEAVLETLVKMHEFAPDTHNEQQVLRKRDHTVAEEELAVNPHFLHWLADEAASKGDEDYLKEVKRVRHQVFGNPLAARKAFDDL